MGACEVEAANEQTLLKLSAELDHETWPCLAAPEEAPGEPEPDLPDAEGAPAINQTPLLVLMGMIPSTI